MKIMQTIPLIVGIFCCACQQNADVNLRSCPIVKNSDQLATIHATIALTGYHDWPAKIQGCGSQKYLLSAHEQSVQKMEAIGEKAFGSASLRPYIFNVDINGRFSSETSGVVFVDVLSIDNFEPNLAVDRLEFLNSRRVRSGVTIN